MFVLNYWLRGFLLSAFAYPGYQSLWCGETRIVGKRERVAFANRFELRCETKQLIDECDEFLINRIKSQIRVKFLIKKVMYIINQLLR